MPTEAATLRRWAEQCGAQAEDPKLKPDERERLLKMQATLLGLADQQDAIDRDKALK